jgi:c-di-GMP-binding flagellar brake protein YcgR
MESVTERRSKARILVGNDVTISFCVKQTDYREVRITNLSAGGCFATLAQADSSTFRQGTRLENFHFCHPELAGPAFDAEVAYVLGGGETFEHLGLGIHFPPLTPSLALALAGFIDQRT